MHGIMSADKRKMNQPGAPDSPCTVCSEYSVLPTRHVLGRAAVGTYVLPLRSFAIRAPTAARAVLNERLRPQPSRGRIVRASSRSPFFRPTNE
eukprot:3996064-Prymnesium_polylepis.1